MIAIKIVLGLAALAFLAYQVWKSIRTEVVKTASGMGEERTLVNVPRIALSATAALAFVFVILPSFGQVSAGHRGIVLRFGAVTGQVLDEGLYFIPPFIASVEMMDVQVHADKASAASASRDLQNVTAEITVNYRLDTKQVARVYQELRYEYVPRILVPAVQEAVKSATAEFDAERLIVERPAVKDRIERFLATRLAQHGLIVDGIAITNFEFSKDFASAIEAKVTSQQLALKARNDLEIVKAEAQQQIETAKAQAEAIRIQAQAINAQGGEDYVRLQAIAKWNGSVPTYVGAGTPIPFINMGAK